MNNTICVICGNEYYFDELDTPSCFAMCCSQHCLDKLNKGGLNDN